jgi:predicted negative regulator of RcsB-dependent stress response
MAWRLDPGTDLVLQLHMLPTGKPETIRPAVGFYFTERPSRVQPFVIGLDSQEIDIAAGEDDYLVEDEIVLPVAVEVLGLYPHAHYLGKTMHVEAVLPDGSRKTLIRIDDWDFNWQDEYRYTRPLPLPAGTTISMRYVYDNSSSNERNPTHPPVRVRVGNRSTDEMGSLQVQVLARSAQDRLLLDEAQSRQKLAKNPAHFAALNNLGNALLAQGRVVEATEHLRLAIRARPDLDEAHYNLGVALAEQGLFDEAIVCYRRALDLNPDLTPAENNLGNAFLALDQTESAIEHYKNALRLQPEFDEAHYNLGNARRGPAAYGPERRGPEAVPTGPERGPRAARGAYESGSPARRAGSPALTLDPRER